MKKNTLSFFLILTILNLFGQVTRPRPPKQIIISGIAYYDAIQLDRLLKTTDDHSKDTIQAILSYYFNNNNAIITPESDEVLVKNNPFIEPKINSWYSSYKHIQDSLKKHIRDSIMNIHDSAMRAVALQKFSALSALPGISATPIGGPGSDLVTNIATGLADFLIERGKEELSVAFFQKFQKFIDTNNTPELNILFPNTEVLIRNFNTSEYANILNTLREAFNKDLHNIISDIIKLHRLNPKNYKDSNVVERVREEKTFFSSSGGRILLSALEIGNGFIVNQKVPDLINVLASMDFIGGIIYSDATVTSNIQSSIKLLNIISLSLKSDKANENYMSKSEINNLFSDDNKRNIYLGLIYQEINNQGLTINKIPIAPIIAAMQTDYSGISYYINQILINSQDLTTAMNNLVAGRKRGEKDLSSYWSAIFESAKQFLIAGKNIEVINPNLKFPPNVDSIFNYGIEVLDIGQDISITNYNAAIVGIIKITSDIYGHKKQPEFLENFIKFASFAANVVAAKSPDDVKSAIESIALPSGSYSVKRTSESNWAINGYIGPGYDIGNPFGQNPAIREERDKELGHLNLYAPVGISISIGKPRMLPIGFFQPKKNHFWRKFPGSLTLFIPIIDVGAIANARIYNDTTTLSMQVTLASIFSPGATIIWGLPCLPISLSFGIVNRPSLIYSNSQNELTLLTGMWRVNASVLIDIPLINLGTTPRKHNKK